MTIGSKIKGWFSEQKSSAVQGIISMQNLGRAVWSDRRYDQFAEEGYRRNAIVYRCINEIAGGSAQVPWLLFRVDSQGNRMEIKSHELLDLLDRPNPWQGGAAFFEAVSAFYQISGNTYIEAVSPDNKPPMELYPLRPDRMKVVAGAAGPAGYEYTVNGTTKTWAEQDNEILHVKTFHPLDDWYGMSPIEAAAFSVDTHNATTEWNKSLLDNRAQPSGALVYTPKEGHKATLDDESYNRLKKQVEDQYTGAKNAGRPMLLEGGLDWRQIGLSPQDMDYLNSKNSSARDIALVLGVPPMILGIPGDNTYSNMKEARLALWENTNLPWLYKLRDELNNWLTPQFGDDLRLDIDEDSISALSIKREAIWDKVQAADFLTINEKREAVNYEPRDGGDEILAPANLLPIGTAPQEDGEKDFADWLVKEQGYSEEKAKELAAMSYGKADGKAV